jgi:hypothetical protein
VVAGKVVTAAAGRVTVTARAARAAEAAVRVIVRAVAGVVAEAATGAWV